MPFPIVYSYSINNTYIGVVTIKKDLGIQFGLDLNYHSHIDFICCKSFKALSFVIRTIKSFKLSFSLKALYCAILQYM